MISKRLSESRIVFSLAVALTGSLFMAGCKQNKPAPAANPQPVAQAPSVVPAPLEKRHIYSETADPTVDIAAALKQARLEHKRVILDFGGDWCGDCQVLDINFHKSPNAELIDKNFIIVHIFIGHMDKHVDVAKKYDIPLQKGVPALAVLDAHGKVLYSQKTGEFEDMRHMDPQSVTDFLNQWKA
jgi:thiol:disulfide interchange protein